MGLKAVSAQAGSQGTQGPQGSAGSQGAQGAAGAQGAQGAAGAQGAQGAAGAQGAQGAAGAQGAQGAAGTSALTMNSQSAAYSTVLGDANNGVLHPTADNSARTFTIDGSVNYPVGSTITFVNQINTLTIAIGTDTLTWAANNTTGSRILAVNGMATALKVASGQWIITGTGLT